MFFQLGALRPNRNHHVVQDILCWMREFWTTVRTSGYVSGSPAAELLLNEGRV